LGNKPLAGNPAAVSFINWKPKKVLFTPSGPTKSGFCRTIGVASRVPAVSKRMGAPPCAE
jgi:hypothetical protein